MPSPHKAPVPFDPAVLLAAAAAWASEHEQRIIKDGEPLNPKMLGYAKELGIRHPERIRVLRVDPIPRPTDPVLAAACNQLGIMTGDGGLCLRYGIYLNARDAGDPELLVHELVHTQQYERLGGIDGFLREYLAQLASPTGYAQAPMEIEARERAAELCRRG